MADPGFRGSCACAQYSNRAHAHRCNESGCCCFNGLFANYTSSKGVSIETVETPLDPPLTYLEHSGASRTEVPHILFASTALQYISEVILVGVSTATGEHCGLL